MSEKHSPGPWRLAGDDSGLVVDANGATVLDARRLRAANARLIMAAPELLEALEDSLTAAHFCACDHPECVSRIAGVRALIRRIREGT